MEAQAQQIAERLRSAARVGVYCHIDADGITGGAIASEALSRADIPHEIAFLQKLDEGSLPVIRRGSPPVSGVVDFAAGPPPPMARPRPVEHGHPAPPVGGDPHEGGG